jgi:LysR family glycine cleavage system transcriptional activator
MLAPCFLKELPSVPVEATSPSRGTSLPSFAALRAFEAVFRIGGIRRAAEQLNLNHTVVSRHIRSLEKWIGVPLVARAGHRLVLTDEGARYHARIAAAFAELEVATDELLAPHREAPLRLWCVPGLSIQWLSAQLADYERQHPSLKVELKPTDVPANLNVHEADADIRYFRDGVSADGGRGLRTFELARPPVLAVTSPDLAAKYANITRDETGRLPFLHEENDSEWRAWLALNGVDAGSHLPGARCWHAHLAIAAARQGRGIALASRFLVAEDLAAGTLIEPSIADLKPVVLGSYVLIAREDRWSSPRLATLRSFLRSRALAFSKGA